MKFKQLEEVKGESNREKKVKICAKLVAEMQLTFAQMALSNKKYADPKSVIENVVDDHLKKSFEGEQEDIMEFNQKFIDCL